MRALILSLALIVMAPAYGADYQVPPCKILERNLLRAHPDMPLKQLQAITSQCVVKQRNRRIIHQMATGQRPIIPLDEFYTPDVEVGKVHESELIHPED